MDALVAVWEVVVGDQPWKGRMMGEIMNMVMNEGSRLEFPATVPKVRLPGHCWFVCQAVTRQKGADESKTAIGVHVMAVQPK